MQPFVLCFIAVNLLYCKNVYRVKCMSSLCKLSKNPEVNLNRFRKAVVQNNHSAVQYLWKHVDVAHHIGDLLRIAAQHSDDAIVQKILEYVDTSSQSFYDALINVVSYPINPHWKEVLPLFLEAASHISKARFLVNYLVFAQYLRCDVVNMVADHIKHNSPEYLFHVLAKKSAQNNRVLALEYIWPYCTPKTFFDEYPLSVWSKQNPETLDFLFNEFSKVQRGVLLQHVDVGVASSLKKI